MVQQGPQGGEVPALPEATYRAVIETVRERIPTTTTRVVIGGKSMGGRIASQIASGEDAVSVDGLVFLGYPLHPPGRPERLRSAHLPSIQAPMLFIQGSRDSFGTPDELRAVLTPCRSARLHIVEGGDHSFKIRGNAASSAAKVYDGVLDEIIRWSRRIGQEDMAALR